MQLHSSASSMPEVCFQLAWAVLGLLHDGLVTAIAVVDMLGAAVLAWQDHSGTPTPTWLAAAAAEGQAILLAILLAGACCAVLAAFATHRATSMGQRQALPSPPTCPDGSPVPLVS